MQALQNSLPKLLGVAAFAGAALAAAAAMSSAGQAAAAAADGGKQQRQQQLVPAQGSGLLPAPGADELQGAEAGDPFGGSDS